MCYWCYMWHCSKHSVTCNTWWNGFGTVYKNSDLFVFIFLQQSFDHFWRKVVFCHLVTATRRFFWQSHAIGKSCICTFIFTIVIVICWAIGFLKFYFQKYNLKCFACNLHPNHAISSQTDQWYFLEEHSGIQCMLTSDIPELDKTVIYGPQFICRGVTH